MGFTINYGDPGVVMAILIALGGAGLAILARFLTSALKAAHDDVVETDEEAETHDGSLG